MRFSFFKLYCKTIKDTNFSGGDILSKFQKLYDPGRFQGKLSFNNYFEGWYYKVVSRDQENVMAFIPGISLVQGDRHAFVQTIDGKTGATHYFSYPLKEVHFDNRSLIGIGPNIFKRDSIDIHLKNAKAVFKGRLTLDGLNPFPRKLLSPGIMGWYAYVPFMECYHGVVSMHHRLSGIIATSSGSIDFTGGKGYIEKDWGKSFPSGWVWLQGNHFSEEDASFMCSIARIPWLGNFFIGFLSFLLVNGTIYRFATYTGAKFRNPLFTEDGFEIELVDRNYKLHIKAHTAAGGVLKAPNLGMMERHIKESVDAEIHISLSDNTGRKIWQNMTTSAGMEIAGDIKALL